MSMIVDEEDPIRDEPQDDHGEYGDAAYAPRVFKINKKEEQKLQKDIPQLYTKIADALEDWWDNAPTRTSFVRGSHAFPESDTDRDAENAGDKIEGIQQMPTVHYVLSRKNRLVANILRSDDAPMVEADDAATFDGLAPDSAWHKIAEDYRRQMRAPVMPTMLPQSPMPVPAAPGPAGAPPAPGMAPQAPQPPPQPVMPEMPAENQDSDNEIAARLLDARLQRYIRKSKDRQFWRRFLDYAAIHRNAAVVTYFDYDDLHEPIKKEMVLCGNWGWDPENLGSIESGKGTFYICELTDREFKKRYGKTPKQVGDEQKEIYSGNNKRGYNSKTDRADYGSKDCNKVQIWFLYDDATEDQQDTEIVTVHDLVGQDGNVIETFEHTIEKADIVANLAAQFPNEPAEMFEQMLKPRKIEIDAVDEDGEPVMVKVPKYTGGIKVVHWYKGAVLRVEDNWNPRGRSPLQAYAWSEVPGQVMGMSTYDLGKDANQAMDRGLTTHLSQCERSIGGAVASKEDIENFDDFIDNQIGGVIATKGGKLPQEVVYFHDGMPVSPYPLQGMQAVKEMADEALGVDMTMSPAKSVQDNAMAQEGYYSELQLPLELMREAFHEFQAEHYTDALAMATYYEDWATQSKIEGDNGQVARIDWTPSVLRFDDQDYDVQYTVKIQTQKNLPRNPIARADYKLKMWATFYQMLRENKEALRAAVDSGDFIAIGSKTKLLRVIDNYKAPETPMPPEVQIKMQELQLRQQQMQSDMQMAQAKMQMEMEKMALDRERANMDHKERMASYQLEIAKLRQKDMLESAKLRQAGLLKATELEQQKEQADADRALEAATTAAEVQLEESQQRAVGLGNG